MVVGLPVARGPACLETKALEEATRGVVVGAALATPKSMAMPLHPSLGAVGGDFDLPTASKAD